MRSCRKRKWTSPPKTGSSTPLRQRGTPKTGESVLVLWDSRKMQSRTIWRGKFDAGIGGAIREMQWFPGTVRALVTMQVVGKRADGLPILTSRHYLLNAATGSFSPFAPPITSGGLYADTVEMSPALPYAVVRMARLLITDEEAAKSMDELGNPVEDQKLLILRDDGVVKNIAFPAGNRYIGPFWSSDPNTMYINAVKTTGIDDKKQKTRVFEYYAVNLKTAQVTKTAVKPKDEVPTYDEENLDKLKPKADPLPVALQKVTIELKDSALAVPPVVPEKADTPKKADKPTAKTLDLLYLQGIGTPTMGTENRLLLAAEAQPALLMPDASAAFYTVRGNLFVAPLIHVDAQTMLTMRQKAQQAQTMSNAKTIATGLMMYAQDYDENFPHDPDTVTDTVSPYIKNGDVFNNPATGKPGFSYTYSGATNLAKIDQPSMTQIGFVTGPGGRAIIFADGHVKWEPQPK